MLMLSYFSFFFFFNDTATTEIYTLSLHDALPILREARRIANRPAVAVPVRLLAVDVGVGAETDARQAVARREDRKSTRLNSSHLVISYAVFCLKKKKFMVGRLTHRQCIHVHIGTR